MTSTSTIYDDRHQRLVRAWLIAVAALIFATVLVGGATRLTESGLSITEWQPISGVVPPLDAAEWQAEFAKYQTIPQYHALNSGMGLDAFKQIFWWEWTHRLLDRVIGVVFLLPFLWFLWKGWIAPRWRAGLWVIFGLGAFEGMVGWWMVASGLADRIEVSQYRLAFHLTLASAIYAALLWTAQRTVPPAAPDAPPHIRVGAAFVLGLVLLQIYLGALVAGLRAGRIYNTWPLMEDHLVPPASQLFFNEPWWRNLFENPMTVQFDHRMTAYALLLAVLLHVWDLARTSTAARALGSAVLLLAAIILQAALGIQTLLHQAPLPLALLHQGTAMVVLTLAVIHAQRVAPPVKVPMTAAMAIPSTS